MFKKFLHNPIVKEKFDLSDEKIQKMDLYSSISDPLIEVIKTAILHMGDDQSVDSVSRKVNQLFKKL
jgi:hypothetical protein